MMDLTRRDFIKGTAATAALAGLAPEAHAMRWFGGSSHLVPKDKKLNIVCVGCGGKGDSDIAGVSSENIIALCDVDRGRMAGAVKRHPDAKLYKDYRKMFEDLGDQFDAVTVSTPDHMHFPIAMLAMQMGKHVYVQKPCAHTVEEARLMQAAAKNYNVSTQMGNQGHASGDTRRIYGYIRSGAIGDVKEVHVYTDRPIWAQREAWPKQDAIPANLDWNLWCGVGPLRPYPKGGMHFKWRGVWDYGCGALGDMGCHIMDGAFWALDLRDPLWIEAESDAPDADTTPNWSIVTYMFPANKWRPPVKLVWYEGKKDGRPVWQMVPRPVEMEEGRNPPGGNGSIFIGTGGKGGMTAGCYGGSPRVFPETRMKQVGRLKPEQMPPMVPDGNNFQEWIRSCKEGGVPAGSNFIDYSCKLTETVLLGNLAIRAHRRIQWDADKMICIGDPEASKFVRQNYRVF